jgi:hypothetical protein
MVEQVQRRGDRRVRRGDRVRRYSQRGHRAHRSRRHTSRSFRHHRGPSFRGDTQVGASAATTATATVPALASRSSFPVSP